MWSEIIIGAIWTTAMGLTLLLAEPIRAMFRTGPEGHELMYILTGYFAFFIFTAAFNAFNARTEKINLFDNISGNHGFWKIIILIIVVQVIMTYFGGSVLSCYGLTVKEWLVILVMSFTIIPVDLIRKAIVKAVSK